MKSLTDFGTETYPIRISSLPLLVKCPWRAAMMFLKQIEDTEGHAADTGSAVHKAIAAFHSGSKDPVKDMQAHFEEYPLADLDEAERQFRAYATDPRNKLAEIVFVEQPVTCEADSVYFTGTVDQVRRVGGALHVWDVKTSTRSGVELLHAYAYQLAGYAVGASEFLNQPVEVGGIIRTRTYMKRGINPAASPDGVFFESTISLSQAKRLLADAAGVALRIRQGDLFAGPGDHCLYCPAKGLGACLPELEKFHNGR